VAAYCHSLDRNGHAITTRSATNRANATADSSLIAGLVNLLPRRRVIGSNQAAALALAPKIKYRQSTLPYPLSELWFDLLLLAFLIAVVAYCCYALYHIGRKLGGAS
jgi:hypothetical protein